MKKQLLRHIVFIIGSILLGGLSGTRACPMVVSAAPKDQPTVILKPNSPNPFYEETTIRFFISSPQLVTVNLYNILGVKIATLLKEKLGSGDHEIIYTKPADLPDGIYICSVETPAATRSKRMIIRR